MKSKSNVCSNVVWCSKDFYLKCIGIFIFNTPLLPPALLLILRYYTLIRV
ncbi:A49 [Sulfolobus spindle-shaped virus Lassen]|nr:A49 [Sulfolobus spindle-shaped virus Lassen]